jgi:Kef-type K+ transport system membrane component KefB
MVDITGYVSHLVSEVGIGIGNQIGHLSISEAIIFDIAVILIVSTMLAFVAKMLRQPLIPAYVLTGLILGPLVLGFVQNMELIAAFSEIGIAFLLFVAGLEISFKKIKEANLKKIVMIGFFQVFIIFTIGFYLSSFLGLTSIQAAYIAIILAFSSTMVDIKLLADRGELVTLHGRLVLGILLLQDLVAIVAIVFFRTGAFEVMALTVSFVKLVAILAVALFLQKFVLRRIFRFAARSTELLFLSSLAVLFFFIILSYLFGLSIIIGAFIAGVSLANSKFKTELESRVSPLRDFFAILFFVALGMQIVFTGVGEMLGLFFLLLLGALILKPILNILLLRAAGYKARTSFLTAISLAQLSEFSLIIGILGVSLGVISTSMFSTIILATIITIAITPYFIDYKDRIYKVFEYPMSLFKFFPVKEKSEHKSDKRKEVLLIGAHRTGGVLLEKLLREKEKLLVVDYNPEIINSLIKKDISCVYGDISSPELIHKVLNKNLKLVISTIPGFEENLHLLNMIKRKKPNTKVIVMGARISETLKLYSKGADYVITPKVLAGEELSRAINPKKQGLKKAKERHLKRLEKIHRILY